MNVGDLEKTTKGRHFLNTWLMPRMAQILNNGCRVLFVGTDTSWDYKPFFWNPGKQCPYFTMDKAEHLKPDIVGSIEGTPEIQDGSFDLVIMIGVYEFLDHPEKAFKEIMRILNRGGYLLIAFPGKGYYSDDRGVNPTQVYDILKDYRILETYNVYEGRDEPNSICVLALKQ